MQRLFKRYHDVGFNIGPTLCRSLTATEPAESRSAASTAKKRFEEIAEPGSIELELNAAAIAAPLIKSAAGLLRSLLPARRWLEPAGPIPIRS